MLLAPNGCPRSVGKNRITDSIIPPLKAIPSVTSRVIQATCTGWCTDEIQAVDLFKYELGYGKPLSDSVSLNDTVTKVMFSQSHETNRYFGATMWGINGAYGIVFDSDGIGIWDVDAGRVIKAINWTH